MATQFKKRNKIAFDLFSKKYYKRIVKPKKEKEVLQEKGLKKFN